MTNAPASFAQWLKQARKEMGYTQKELANLAGCSTTSVRKIEAGSYHPSRQIAQRLVESMEVPFLEQETLVKLARTSRQSNVPRSPITAGSSEDASTIRAGDLPAQATRILGREPEKSSARALLLQEDVRLLTLTGPPGIGKTRLALYICESLLDTFTDGIFFVPLATVSDPALVAPTIARTLDVQETSEQTAYAALVSYLQSKRLLLLLDNFEQVAAAAPVVAGLLSECAHLTILVTSREVLQTRGEHQFPVPPLDAPDPLHLPLFSELGEYPAVRLFVERSGAVNPAFVLSEQNAGAVAEICARLDGLPLAIEIAAARTKLFSPQEIQERLVGRLSLLTSRARDLPERQQTLRKAIDWSYHLLSEAEQILFARMSVFVGGCTLSAAGAICDPMGNLGVDIPDGVESLLNKSLLQQVESASGERRLTMLETLREYAQERLEKSGEYALVRSWYAQYYIGLAEAAEPELVLQNQLVWIDRLEQDHDNLRATLTSLLRPESAAEIDGSKQLALRLSGALWRFWHVRGHFTEGRRWLESTLAFSEGTDGGKDSNSAVANPAYRAKALHGLGGLAFSQGDLAAALEAFREALVFWGKAGDAQGAAKTLTNMGLVAASLGDHESARRYYEEGLESLRELGDKGAIARTLNNLGILAHERADYEEALSLHEESLLLAKELGNKAGVGASMTNLGLVNIDLGDYGRARQLLQESLAISQELGSNYGVAGAYINLSVVDYLEGDHIREVALLRSALAIVQEAGDNIGIASCVEGIGAAMGVLGHPFEGTRLLAAGAALREAISAPLPPKDRARYQQSLAAVRVQLSDEAFTKAWAEGRILSFEDAAQLALTL